MTPLKIPLELVILSRLREIAIEADHRRASVLLELFQQEYPDTYDFLNGLTELPPAKVIDAIAKRWPAAGKALSLFEGAIPLIAKIQVEIKSRRENTDGPTS